VFSKAKFRVLYKGQPLANAEVSATYDYYDYKTANAYTQTAKTDNQGEVGFKIDNSGLWLIRVSDTRPSSYPGTDKDISASVQAGTAVDAAAPHGRPPQILNIVLGLSLMLNIYAVWYFIRRRRAHAHQ
jgi:hypothetical protein